MTHYQNRALELRASTAPHYNCAQAVFIPFAEELGLSVEQAAAVAAHFGSGMRMAATCGAVTGALMALGLLGCPAAAAQDFLKEFKQEEGCTECARLLAIGKEKPQGDLSHCNTMIVNAIALVEKVKNL